MFVVLYSFAVIPLFKVLKLPQLTHTLSNTVLSWQSLENLQPVFLLADVSFKSISFQDTAKEYVWIVSLTSQATVITIILVICLGIGNTRKYYTYCIHQMHYYDLLSQSNALNRNI